MLSMIALVSYMKSFLLPKIMPVDVMIILSGHAQLLIMHTLYSLDLVYVRVEARITWV